MKNYQLEACDGVPPGLINCMFSFSKSPGTLAIPDYLILIIEINMIWNCASVPAKAELFLAYPYSEGSAL